MFNIQESLKLEDIHNKFKSLNWEPIDYFLSENKSCLNRLYSLTGMTETPWVSYHSSEKRLHIVIISEPYNYKWAKHIYEQDDNFLKIDVYPC